MEMTAGPLDTGPSSHYSSVDQPASPGGHTVGAHLVLSADHQAPLLPPALPRNLGAVVRMAGIEASPRGLHLLTGGSVGHFPQVHVVLSNFTSSDVLRRQGLQPQPVPNLLLTGSQSLSMMLPAPTRPHLAGGTPSFSSLAGPAKDCDRAQPAVL